jgi:large subunit ribosomal protein L4
VNKKEKIIALKCVLSDKVKKNQMIFVDSLELKSHKTQDLFKSLQNFSFNSALFIHGDEEKTINFRRASSNIPKITTLLDEGINVKDLILFEKIFIEKISVQKISKRLL